MRNVTKNRLYVCKCTYNGDTKRNNKLNWTASFWDKCVGNTSECKFVFLFSKFFLDDHQKTQANGSTLF